jgi:hypothetical protein
MQKQKRTRSKTSFFLTSLNLLAALAVTAVSQDAFCEGRTFNVGAGTNEVTDSFLRIKYKIDCQGPQSQGIPGLAGTLELQGSPSRMIRFDLFQGNTELIVSLGHSNEFPGGRIEITPYAHSQCTGLESITPEIINESQLLNRYENEGANGEEAKLLYQYALEHSPYLVVRKDQYENRATDFPLDLIYSQIPNDDDDENTLKIRYTYFFSDEDSKTSAKEVGHQMARYGRMTDVEWIYEVVVDRATGRRISATYQGSFWDKFKTFQVAGDHAEMQMKGEFWGSTNHPILYNVANNNVFADQKKSEIQKNYVAFHPGILPHHFLAYPLAREKFQFSDHGLYMFLVSEVELRDVRRLPARPSEYLYFTVHGELLPDDTALNINNGAFKIDLEVIDGDDVVYTTQSSKPVDRLGEDLFKKESIAAVQIPLHILTQLSEDKLNVRYKITDARSFIKSERLEVMLSQPFILVWDEELGRYKRRHLPDGSCQLSHDEQS